jgi:hypothetical protein
MRLSLRHERDEQKLTLIICYVPATITLFHSSGAALQLSQNITYLQIFSNGHGPSIQHTTLPIIVLLLYDN